jgi:hypothetical protein
MEPIRFDAFEVFVQEHRRCDVLDGGVDNDLVWLQCSCGGLINAPGGGGAQGWPPLRRSVPSEGAPFPRPTALSYSISAGSITSAQTARELSCSWAGPGIARHWG